MKSILLICSSFLCLLGASGQSTEQAASTSSSRTYDDYKVIYENNIFSKNRRQPRSDEHRSRRTRTTKVLSVYVLRGIAAEAGQDQRYAFVEEEVAGQTQIARVGTEILGGTITGIQMNYVLYDQDGQTRKIAVGQQFGTTSKTVTSEVSDDDGLSDTSEAGGSSSEASDSPSSDDDGDVLKKMLERRKREMGT